MLFDTGGNKDIYNTKTRKETDKRCLPKHAYTKRLLQNYA